ncbi:MAG: hypothetical protein ACTS3F_02800 [Phycisphaerales bacterium]
MTTTPNPSPPIASIRCGFCGYEVAGLLEAGITTCPECGGELDDHTIATEIERPPAARSPLGMIALLAIGAGAGLAVAWLPFPLARLTLGEAPVGLVLAISLNACWWLLLAPLFAMAWADNLIRACALRRKLPLAGLSPIYLGIPVFCIMVAAAWPIAWPVLKPWILGAPQGVAGPTAAPSALQTGAPAPPQPNPSARP